MEKVNRLSDEELNLQGSPRDDHQRIFFTLIEKVGSFGRYQKLTILFWALSIFFCGELLFSVPFLFYQDPYQCPDFDEGCREYVCSLPSHERASYVPPPSFHSLANDLGDYRCPQQQVKLNGFIAITYFGTVLGFLLLAVLGEAMSKRALMIANFGCYVLGLGGFLIFYKYEYIMVVFLMISVLGSSNCYIITFIFLIEIVEKKSSQKYSVLVQAFYAFGVLANVFFFWLINDWWAIFFYTYVIPSLILFACICLTLVDTPMSLVLRNSPQKAFERLNFIGKMNAVDQVLTLQDIVQAKEKYIENVKNVLIKQISFIEVFKYKSTRYLVIILVILQCTITFVFSAPALMLESFHFDVYISGMTVALPQIFSSLISSIVIQKFKRKTINFVCFGCAFVTSFALIFIWDQNVDDSDPENLSTHILVLVLIFLLQFSITTQYTTFYIYTNEVFATQARMIAISIISLIGGLVTTGTSFIIGVCLENHFPIMIIFTFLSAVCVLLTIYLPETLGKVPRDIIDELQIGKSRSIDQSSDQLTKNLSQT